MIPPDESVAEKHYEARKIAPQMTTEELTILYNK